MTTANLSVGLRSDSALQSLRALKATMQAELRGGIMLSVDAASLVRSAQESLKGERFKLSLDTADLRSNISATVRQALAEPHKVAFDAAGLTAQIRAAVSAGLTGGTVKVGLTQGAAEGSAATVDRLKSTIAQILVPAVDSLSKAAEVVGKADRATRSSGALRASESVGYINPETGKRTSVVKSLTNPLEELKKAEAALAAKAVEDARKKQETLDTKLAREAQQDANRTLSMRRSFARTQEAQDSASAREAQLDANRTYAMRRAFARSQDTADSAAAREAQQDSNRTFTMRRNLARATEREETAAARAAQQDSSRTYTMRRNFARALERDESAAAKEAQQDANRTFAMRRSFRKAEEAAMQKEMASFLKQARFDAATQYTGKGVDIQGAQALSQRFGPGQASSFLGANSFLLGKTDDLPNYLRKVADGHEKAGLKARISAADHKLVRNAMEDAHSASRGLAGSLGVLWATWGNTAPILAAAAIGSSLIAVVKLGQDVEYQLKFVSTLTDGGAVSLQKFGDAVRGSMVMPGEAGLALRGLAQNGLSLAESLQALPTILALATAGEMSLMEAATGATGVMAAFSLTVSELPRVSDVFAKAAAISNTNVASMVEAMKQASTVSDKYHVSLEQTAAALATMAKLNIEGSAAGTAFRNMWLELATPTKKAQDALKALGLELYDSNHALIDSDEALKRLHDRLSTLSEASRLTALNSIFGERGDKAANAIISNMEVYSSTLSRIKNESKDFTRTVVSALNDTVQGKTKALMTEFQLSAVEAFDGSSTAIKNFVDSLRLIAGSDQFVSTLKSMTEGVVNLTTFLVQHGDVVLTTLAIWKTTQWVLAARAGFLAIKIAAAEAGVAVSGFAVAGRAAMSAITGGMSLVIGLGIEYLLLRDKTDAATSAQTAYNNALDLESQKLRAAQKGAEERVAMLQRQIKYQREGLSLEQAREKADSETAVNRARSLDEEYAKAKSKQELDKQTLASVTAEVGRSTRFGSSAAPSLLAKLGDAREAVKRNEEVLQKILLARNDAALAANASNLENEAAFQGKRLEQIRVFNIRVADALKNDPKLKLADLKITADLAPVQASEFEAFMKARNEAFNANARNIPNLGDDKAARRAAREAESLSDKLRNALEARDRAMAALEKSQSDLATQAQREHNAELLDINQSAYDAGLRSYAGYLAEKRALTEQEREDTVAEAEKLANQLRSAANKKMLAYFQTPEKDPDDLLKMRTATLEAEKSAIEAEAKVQQARADASRGRRNDQSKVSGNIRSTVQNAKDSYLDSLNPGFNDQARQATIAANMQAELEIYAQGSKERIELERQVAQFVEITEKKLASDTLQAWANSLTGSLGAAAEGFAMLSKGVQSYMETQRGNAEQKDKFAQMRDEAKGDTKQLDRIGKLEQAQIKRSEAQQISAYASMAASGKKFFKEHTVGYKALEAAEQGLRTYQMVMSSKALVEDVMNIGRRVGAWIFGETSMTAASTIASNARIGSQIAENTTAGTGAILNQGNGDPYTAIPRMAAMAAIVAGLGIAVGSFGGGGGGSKIDAAKIQAGQGTGTVFGDADAKSKSIENSLKHLEEVSSPQLKWTIQMAASLRSIDSSLKGVSGQILRTGGSLTGVGFVGSSAQNNLGTINNIHNFAAASAPIIAAFDKAIGGIGRDLAGKILGGFFGSTKSNLADSGIQFWSTSLDTVLRGGLAASAYQVVETTTKKNFGLSKNTSVSTGYGGLDSAISDQLTAVIKDIYNSVDIAGQALGNSAQTMKDRLLGISVDLGRLSLKGLSGAQIQEQLTAVFGAFGDRLAAAGEAGVADFQKVGEGYLETLIRVASGFEEAKSYTDQLGVSLVNYKDLINKQGDVPAELVRQSILAVETATGIGKIIDGLSGTASDLSEMYTTLLGVRYSLQSFGATTVQVTSGLILGAGTLDKLTQGVSDYYDNILTESERLAASTSSMTREFAKLGLSMPTTNAEFKALLGGIDGSTEAGQKLYGALIALSGSFSSMTDQAKAFDSSKMDLQIALLRAQGKEEQAVAMERARTLEATDPLLKALQQQVWATEDLAEKYEKLKDAGRSLADFIDSLTAKTTDSNSLTATRAAYLSNMSLARNDDPTALSKTVSVAQAYIDAAKNNARSQAEYVSIVGQVRAEITALNATQTYLKELAATEAPDTTTAATNAFTEFVQSMAAQQGAAAGNASTESRDMIAEWAALRVDLKAANNALATHALLIRKILERWEADRIEAESP